MAATLEQVYKYLDEHPVSRSERGFDSILEALHWAYTENNPIYNETIRHKMMQMDDILDKLTRDDSEDLFCLICDVCLEYEHLAFYHGMTVGLHLMTEINALP